MYDRPVEEGRVTADDPIARFAALFERARREEPADPTAMALATADAQGRPSVRMVLLKGADARGFVFFTNRNSRKARELAENARAALCAHWPTLAVQVRVEGGVETVSDAESDAYYATRPRESQIGAWASRQSEPLASREELLAAFDETSRRYASGPVPRPPNWGGYRILPERIEFWRSREFRLHERLLYVREGGTWRPPQILAP
jgi:pyridoxamine 5'-phosphate oxidase